MTLWLIVVAVLVLAWGAMWKNYPRMALGALIGMPIGWLLSYPVHSYLTGEMEDIPIWLPPLPLATIAVLLIVVGLVIFLRGDDTPSSTQSKNDESHH
jgi:hypothetical protein